MLIPSNDVTFSLHTADWLANGGHLVEAGLDVFEVTDGLDAGILTSFEQDELITVFPNPNNGQFTILLSADQNVQQVSIIDMSGRTVTTLKGNKTSHRIEGLSHGMYFVQVNIENRVITTKIIVK